MLSCEAGMIWHHLAGSLAGWLAAVFVSVRPAAVCLKGTSPTQQTSKHLQQGFKGTMLPQAVVCAHAGHQLTGCGTGHASLAEPTAQCHFGQPVRCDGLSGAVCACPITMVRHAVMPCSTVYGGALYLLSWHRTCQAPGRAMMVRHLMERDRMDLHCTTAHL